MLCSLFRWNIYVAAYKSYRWQKILESKILKQKGTVDYFLYKVSKNILFCRQQWRNPGKKNIWLRLLLTNQNFLNFFKKLLTASMHDGVIDSNAPRWRIVKDRFHCAFLVWEYIQTQRFLSKKREKIKNNIINFYQ